MIELSHYSVILAFILTIIVALLPIGLKKLPEGLCLLLSKIGTVLYTILTLGAFIGLTWAYIVSDFSVINVAENSHSTKPLLYKITGVWGNHEGSMLLWVLILSVHAFALVITQRKRLVEWQIKVLSIQSALVSGFLLFVLVLSNPFLRIANPPLEGSGLNPLLQDPSLAWHPPVLYTGYLGFSVIFTMALVGLWQQNFGQDWVKTIKPWVLWTWGFLTAGIGLGSWWAYYELGWGGWWFWDPVENASLLPWLLGIALIHGLMVKEKSPSFFTIGLALSCFIASVLGTFLVRSGMISSVHSFALDPERGFFILLLASLIVFSAVALFIRYIKGQKGKFIVEESPYNIALKLNNCIFLLLTLIVALGTFYPLFHDLVTGQTLTVGIRFYNIIAVPLSLGMAVIMVWASFVHKTQQNKWHLWLTCGLAIVAVSIGLVGEWQIASFLPWVAMVIGFAILLSLIFKIKHREKRKSYGMIVTHAGLAVLIIAVGFYEAGKQEKTLILKPKQSWQLAHFHGTMEYTDQVFGKNYVAHQATLSLYRGNHFLTHLTPQMRFYPVENGMTIESDYYVGLFGQFYIAADRWLKDEKAWQVRLYWHPMLPFLWLGILMMIAGAGLSWWRYVRFR